MTVYVDKARNKLGRMIMCHVFADTLEELHDACQAVGLRREWYQGPPKTSRPHYDASLSVRKQLIDKGAVEICRYETVYRMKILQLEEAISRGCDDDFVSSLKVQIAGAYENWQRMSK